MKKMKNNTHIEGYVYEHELKQKVSGDNSKNPGTPFINGTLKIATDESCTNIIEVHFSYVTAVTAKGMANETYRILNNIIEGSIGNVMADGLENAGMVRIDSALDLNEFYDKENNLVSLKRNEGGFIHTIASPTELKEEENKRSTFETDMVITGCKRLEANEEKGTVERVIVKGYVFNFRNALLPVEFTVVHPGAMNYFESLEATSKNPAFTLVRGEQISRIVTKKVEEVSAWGEVTIRETKSSSKDFVINWAQPDVYDWDDENTILAEELSEAMANRNVYLADVKKRQDEWKASQSNAIKAATTAPKTGGYNF